MKEQEILNQNQSRKHLPVAVKIILGILGLLILAIGVPGVSSARINSRAKSCAANLKMIENAIWMAQKDGVTITPPNVPFSILKEKGYIQKKPQCPLGYDYILDSSKTVLCPMHGDLKNFSKGDAPWTDKAIVLGIIVITTIILIVL